MDSSFDSNPMVKKFNEFLDIKGLRKTSERSAIISRIASVPNHFTIDQLQQMMDETSFHVSRATLYNTVELMLEAGLLRRHVFEGMQAQYERVTTPHTHLVCTTCGKIKEVRDANFIGFMNARRFTAFNVDYYSLYVYGTCSTCARKQRRMRVSAKSEKSPNKSKTKISQK